MADKQDLRQINVRKGDLVLLVNPGNDFTYVHAPRVVVAQFESFVELSPIGRTGKHTTSMFYAPRAVVFNAGTSSEAERKEEWKGGVASHTRRRVYASFCTIGDRIEVGEQNVLSALQEISPEYQPDVKSVMNYRMEEAGMKRVSFFSRLFKRK